MESKSKGVFLTLAILAAVGVTLAAMLIVLNRKDESVGLDREIQYDDFAFSVLSVRQANSVGGAVTPLKPQGVFYIVTLKIANHAKRVDFKYKRDCPVLVDERGREYLHSAEGQSAIETTSSPAEMCATPIPAGQSCVTQVVFDVPAGVRASQFRITVGGPLGDMLNDIFWGRKRIELGPVTASAPKEQ